MIIPAYEILASERGGGPERRSPRCPATRPPGSTILVSKESAEVTVITRTAADDGRKETAVEQLDRNWADLLQELRVTQTGVQLLTGLLLTLPFQQRFLQLAQPQRIAYLVAAALAVTSTGLLIAPVALHRALFRQHARSRLVVAGHVFAVAGLATLGLAVTGVVFVIFGMVLDEWSALTAAAMTLALFTALWALLPWLWRRKTQVT